MSEEQRKEIWYYCGRSPFYLAIMGEALLEDPSAHIDAVSSQFFDSFEAVISLLKEEDLLTAMLQMFVGPRYNMSESDIQKLVAMGYCMKRSSLDCGAGAAGEYANYFAPEDTGEYLTISGYFIDYLSDVHQKEADGIWPKLSHTERGLRRIITNEYERLYPDTWKEKLKEIALKKGTENVHEGFLREHDKVYRRADADQQKLVGNSILNVISLKALGGIIKADWAVFQKYFSCGRQRFSDDILVLYHARNPISHSNGELLTPADIAAVEDICNQFLTSIDCAAAAAPSPRR